jgi:hypothetical protein
LSLPTFFTLWYHGVSFEVWGELKRNDNEAMG